MKKVAVLVLGLAALTLGCGNNYNSNSTPPLPVTLSVTPASASLQTSGMLQFMATVNNTSNTTVTWQVDGTTGGSTTVGTVSTSGLYTAPASVPPAENGTAAGQVTVTAISAADSTVSASATVTITAATKISVSPSTVTVLAGATQQFTASVSGSSGAVTWQVNGVTGGSATNGTIATGGLYTAPVDPPSGQKVTVTAISQAESSVSASATVTVAPSVATLNGLYAFSFKGYNSLGLLLEAGSFQADGKGNITNGVEDINSGAGVFSDITFTGTYTVNSDGRASLLLTPPLSTGLNAETYDIVLVSQAHARLVRYDGFATGIGSLDLQDSSAFSTAALTGNVVMSLDGIDDTGTIASLASIGLLTFDGKGTVSTGLLDVNNNGSSTLNNSVSGTYSVDSPASNGRGEITVTGSVGTFDFTFYIVSTGQIRLVSTDSSPVWGGTGSSQAASSFSNASLHGSAVFVVQGVNNSGTVADAGRFVSTSAGGVVDGVGDENSNGTVTQAYSFTGSYSIGANGHGTLQLTNSTLGVYNYALDLEADGQAVLLRTDPAADTIGVLSAQSQSLFASSDVNGAFGFSLDGVSSTGPIDKLGQMTLSGGSGTGTEDINADTILNSNVGLTATYTVGANGVGTLNVTAAGGTRILDLYLVSPSEMFLIGLDSDQVLTGGAEQQFK